MIRFKLGIEPGLRYVSSLVLNPDCDTFLAWNRAWIVIRIVQVWY